MLQPFASHEATAIANILVFSGILFAFLKYVRRNWAGWSTSWSKLARDLRRRQIISEIKDIKRLEKNPLEAYHMFAKAMINDVASGIIFIGFFIFLIFYALISEMEDHLEGEDAAIWSDIYSKWDYYPPLIMVIFGSVVLMAAYLTLMLKANLKPLKRAAFPAKERRKLIIEYLQLRARR